VTFQLVYEHIIDKAPHLAAKNTHVIHEWLAKGYDPVKDIIPAIDHATKHGTVAIHSFAYFTGYIRVTNEKRIKAEVTAPKQPLSQQQRYDTFKWKQDRGMFLTTSEEKFMKDWEAATA
jgi:hypothetical protein